MKLKNIVVATEKRGYYNVLEQSCKRHNIELIPLGMGEKWTGFTMRFELWLKYLNTLHDDEIVMINDAYDVIILEDGDTIIKKFKSFNKNVVLGMQKSLEVKLFFPDCDNFKWPLCMGNMIGYVKYLKQLIKHLFEYPNLWKKYHNDDQMILNDVCNRENVFFKKHVGLDINKKLFFATTGGIEYLYNTIFKRVFNLYMKNNKLYTDNNITPSVLHLAGNLNGNSYLQYLNYSDIPDKNMFIINPYKTEQLVVFLKIILFHKTLPLIFTIMSIIIYLYFFKVNIHSSILFMLLYIFIFGYYGIIPIITVFLLLIISVQYLILFIKKIKN